MKIIQLEYFCAVCRYHSITQAAQKLYVTQPAISNAIRELEKEFSVSLFSRTKNHIVLTKEGEAFYQKASVLLDNIHSHRYSAAFEHCLFPGYADRLLQKIS